MGAVFVGIGQPPSFEEKLRNLMKHPAYERTPWVGIWMEQDVQAFYRTGQPFDGELVKPRVDGGGPGDSHCQVARASD